MKLKNTLTTILFSTLLLIPLAAQDYPVRGIPIDSPKFEAIYQAVLKSRSADSAATLTNIKIIRHLNDSLYLAEIVRGEPGAASQAMDMITGGISAINRQIRDLQRSPKVIAVNLFGMGQLVDGKRLEVPLVPSKTPYQYFSETEEKVTVDQYQIVEPDDYSKAHFYSDLQAGNKFPVTIQKKVKCPDCLGFPSASISRGECKSCDRAGFLNVPVSLVVVW